MCFSVEADLVAGAALLPIGVLAVSKVREPRELAFASLPLLFAAHQLVEALVWAGASGEVSATIAHRAATAYVWFALPLLPAFLPVAVWVLTRRRRVLPFVGLGLVVAVHFARTLVANGVRTDVHPHAIVYRIGLADAELWTGLYVLAVMGACVVAGHRAIVAFGVVNLVGLSVVALAYRDAFASLWCVYAAVSSVLVLVHLAHRPDRQPAPAGDDGVRAC